MKITKNCPKSNNKPYITHSNPTRNEQLIDKDGRKWTHATVLIGTANAEDGNELQIPKGVYLLYQDSLSQTVFDKFLTNEVSYGIYYPANVFCRQDVSLVASYEEKMREMHEERNTAFLQVYKQLENKHFPPDELQKTVKAFKELEKEQQSLIEKEQKEIMTSVGQECSGMKYIWDNSPASSKAWT